MSSLQLRSRSHNRLHLSVYQTQCAGANAGGSIGERGGAKSLGEASRRLQVDPEEVKTLLQQQMMPYELADALIRQIDGDAIASLPEEEVSLLGELHLVERPTGGVARPTPSVDEMPRASTPDPVPVTPIPSVVGGSCSVDHLADEPAATADVALPRNGTVVSNITDENASLLMSDILVKDAVPSSYDEEPCDEVSPPVLPVPRPQWSGKRVRRYVRSLNRRIKAMSLSPKPRTTVVDIPDGLFAQYSRGGGTVGPKTATEAAAAAGKPRGSKGKPPDGQDPSEDEKGSKGSRRRGGGGEEVETIALMMMMGVSRPRVMTRMKTRSTRTPGAMLAPRTMIIPKMTSARSTPPVGGRSRSL